jgi:predicted PurR-regulated permease PerM
MSYSLSVATRNQLIFWSGAILLFLLFLYAFSAVLLPFVLGIAVAYLLDPVVGRITRWKLPRWAAALIILFVFVLFVAAAAALILPVAYRELMQLAEALPGYAEKIWTMLTPYVTWAQEKLGQDDLEGLKESLRGNIDKVLTVSGGVLGGLAAGGRAVTGFLSTVLITPIVAYYMMKEWPAIKNWFNNLLPRKHYNTIQDLLEKIDRKVAGFVRGQITVAFLLAVSYAVALSIAGLNYGFLIGFMAGVLSIIPMVGSAVGLVVAVGVAWFQSGTLMYTGIIAAIFLTGQILEGSFLSPKLLGDSVGLHPVWILFALMAGGALYGIVGMLLAVPVIAVIGVLVSFAIGVYKDSAYFNNPDLTKKKA